MLIKNIIYNSPPNIFAKSFSFQRLMSMVSKVQTIISVGNLRHGCVNVHPELQGRLPTKKLLVGNI